MTSRRSSLQSKCRWVSGVDCLIYALRGRRECVSISCVARQDYFGVHSVTCALWRERKMRGAARCYFYFSSWCTQTWNRIAEGDQLDVLVVCVSSAFYCQRRRRLCEWMNIWCGGEHSSSLLSLCAPFIDSLDLAWWWCVRCMFVSPRSALDGRKRFAA